MRLERGGCRSSREVGEVTDHRPVVMVFAGCWGSAARRRGSEGLLPYAVQRLPQLGSEGRKRERANPSGG